MTRITLKLQQPTGEVERHIDRANGAPTVEAAMCRDNGTKEIGHVDYAFLLSLSSSHAPIFDQLEPSVKAAAIDLRNVCMGPPLRRFQPTRRGRTLLARFRWFCRLLLRIVTVVITKRRDEWTPLHRSRRDRRGIITDGAALKDCAPSRPKSSNSWLVRAGQLRRQGSAKRHARPPRASRETLRLSRASRVFDD